MPSLPFGMLSMATAGATASGRARTTDVSLSVAVSLVPSVALVPVPLSRDRELRRDVRVGGDVGAGPRGRCQGRVVQSPVADGPGIGHVAVVGPAGEDCDKLYRRAFYAVRGRVDCDGGGFGVGSRTPSSNVSGERASRLRACVTVSRNPERRRHRSLRATPTRSGAFGTAKFKVRIGSVLQTAIRYVGTVWPLPLRASMTR